MTLWRLRLAMIATALATVVSGAFILYLIFTLFSISLTFQMFLMIVVAFSVVIILAQWLLAPYFIDMVCMCREADPYRYRDLHNMVRELAEKSGLKKIPKVMIARIPIPNAFAYGSPLTGPRVAVTEPLLDILDKNELKAVLGHEIGHLKHRDVAMILAIGLIPTILWNMGDMMYRLGFWSMIFGIGDRDSSYAYLLLLGIVLIAIAFILSIFVLAFSRYREYYADRHSVMLNPRGGKLLQRALAKIVLATKYGLSKEDIAELASALQFKTLFIQDPLVEVKTRFRDIDSFIEYLKNRKLTLTDRIKELFSTHPDITKRLRMLDKYDEEFWGKIYEIPVE
ncbi:MAG: M48 family metalloprotease [Crenarchaeota archaeon]|nr:M48 family metalloprotease [Thermoproteota archaeon]